MEQTNFTRLLPKHTTAVITDIYVMRGETFLTDTLKGVGPVVILYAATPR